MAEEMHESDSRNSRDHGFNIHRRQARVTVKYNRKELQKRLDVEKWIDEALDKLYEGKKVRRSRPLRDGWELLLSLPAVQTGVTWFLTSYLTWQLPEKTITLTRKSETLADMPEEVNIDDLLDLPSDEARAQKLQVLLQSSGCDTEAFITELLLKLHGLHKQEELQKEGIEHPSLHNYPHHHGNIPPHRDNHGHPAHQTL